MRRRAMWMRTGLQQSPVHGGLSARVALSRQMCSHRLGPSFGSRGLPVFLHARRWLVQVSLRIRVTVGHIMKCARPPRSRTHASRARACACKSARSPAPSQPPWAAPLSTGAESSRLGRSGPRPPPRTAPGPRGPSHHGGVHRSAARRGAQRPEQSGPAVVFSACRPESWAASWAARCGSGCRAAPSPGQGSRAASSPADPGTRGRRGNPLQGWGLERLAALRLHGPARELTHHPMC